MKPIIFASRIAFISWILLSCTSCGSTSYERNQGPIYIAIVAPFSGPLSEFGWSMLRGGRMRTGEGKDQILLNGRAVKLMALDDGGNAGKAIRLAKNMRSHQSIVSVVGHLTTGCTLSAIPLYNAAQLIHISSVATGEDLQSIKSPYTFRTILSEGRQAISLADYMYRTLNGKEVVLIYEDSPLGKRLKHSFLSRGKDIGLYVKEILVKVGAFQNLSETIDRIITLRPGAIFIAGGPDFAGMIVRKWPEKVERPLIFGTYRLVSEEFIEMAGKHGKGILAAHPCVWRSDFERGRDIKDRYEKRFKYTMDWLAIQSYDAIDLLLWAINKGGMDPASIRGALQGLNSKNSSMSGLTGPIYFDPDGSLAREVTVATYTGSRWELRD